MNLGEMEGGQRRTRKRKEVKEKVTIKVESKQKQTSRIKELENSTERAR